MPGQPDLYKQISAASSWQLVPRLLKTKLIAISIIFQLFVATEPNLPLSRGV